MSTSVEDLPNEVLEYAFQLLPTARDKFAVLGVSRRWRAVGLAQSLWRTGDLCAPLWLPLAVARQLLALRPEGLLLSLTVETGEAGELAEVEERDTLELLGRSCESLRITNGAPWYSAAYTRFIAPFARAGSNLRHLCLPAHMLPLARRAMEDRTAFTQLEYYSPEYHNDHYPPTADSNWTKLLVELMISLPRLTVMRVKTMLFEGNMDPRWLPAPVCCPMLREITFDKYRMEEDMGLLWCEFLRRCPRLTTLTVPDTPLRDIWPDDIPLPPLQRLTIRNSSRFLHDEGRELPLVSHLTFQCTVPTHIPIFIKANFPDYPQLRMVEYHYTIEGESLDEMREGLAEYATLMPRGFSARIVQVGAVFRMFGVVSLRTERESMEEIRVMLCQALCAREDAGEQSLEVPRTNVNLVLAKRMPQAAATLTVYLSVEREAPTVVASTACIRMVLTKDA